MIQRFNMHDSGTKSMKIHWFSFLFNYFWYLWVWQLRSCNLIWLFDYHAYCLSGRWKTRRFTNINVCFLS